MRVLSTIGSLGDVRPLVPPSLPPLPGQTPAPETADNRELWARDAERFNDLFGNALNSHRALMGLAPVSDARSYIFTNIHARVDAEVPRAVPASGSVLYSLVRKTGNFPQGRLVTMERPAPIRSSWVTLRDWSQHIAEPHAKEPVMSNVRFIGLDVHAETIAVAVAEPDGEVRSLGVIPNRSESIRKLVKKLGPAAHMRVCYEAGPTGYVVYWELTALGVKCEVLAPTLVPVKAGDRVKTDRRDALKLARSYRAGDLTAVWVPDAAHEALRDLVRAREAAKKDQLRARHRLGKFLLRRGQRPPATMNPWTQAHLTWIKTVHFAHAAQEATLLDYLHEVEHVADRIERLERAIDEAVKTAPERMRAVIEALQALRGIALVSAVTIAAEVGELSRFATPRQLRGYSGAVPSEDSTGDADPAGRHHQDGQCAPPARRD